MSEFEIGGTPDPYMDPNSGVTPPMPEPEIRYVDKIVYKQKSVVGYWIGLGVLGFLFIASAITAIALLFVVSELSDQNDQLSSENTDLQYSLTETYEEKTELEQTLTTLTDRIGSSYPLIINDIEIGNVEHNNDIITDFGGTIYTSKAKYLKPQLKYYGIIDGSRTLKTKWINPDGTIITGNSSPSGFSQSAEYTIESGPNHTLEMGGWGWDDTGNWTPGTYRLEVWYGSTCLKSKTFTVYY